MVNYKNDLTIEVREEMRGGKLHAEITKLSKELPEKVRLFATIRLIPGASIGYHVHENETEMFYFAEGTGIVKDDETEKAVSAGDSMLTFPGHGHAVENNGDKDLVLVAVIVKE